MTDKTQRCSWGDGDELYTRYHDEEWGVPLRDADALFELLVMEGMQAGLSWITILRKRKRFRETMYDLIPDKIAKVSTAFIDKLLLDPGIIRHRGKLEASVSNANAWITLGREIDIVEFIWSFTNGETKHNRWKNMSDVPAFTPESEAMTRALRKKGFKFVGPTICYAFMQSAGMVNDHTVACFRHRECGSADRKLIE